MTSGSRTQATAVTLRANHFRLNIGQELYVFQYALTVQPAEVFDAAVVHDILAMKNRQLFKMLGAYVPSGRTIYTMAEIEETINIETSYKGKPCEIIIDKGSETRTLMSPEFINRQNSVVQGILNIIFKTAFRQTHLR